MVSLKRLAVRRFRHVTPGTELRFDPSRNIVLGRNGAGKTTLLDLVASTVSGDLGLFASEPFDIDFEIQLDGATIAATVTNEARRQASALAVSAGDTREANLQPSLKTHFNFSAEATLSIAGRQYRCTSTRTGIRASADQGEEIAALDEPASVDAFLVDLTMALAKSEVGRKAASELLPVLRTQIALMSLRRLDEALETFKIMTETKLSFHVSDEGTSVMRFFMSDDLAAAARMAFNASPGDKTAPLTIRDVPFLDRAAKLFGYVGCFVSMQLVGKEVVGKETRYSYGSMRFSFQAASGNIITHERLSYGQKRMLAFLYYAAANDSVLVADELVNGLHYSWIDEALELMEGRQKFLTSQNPLLLDHLTFESAAEAARSFICCTGDDSVIAWRNLSEEQADRFYRAYTAGIQYVGEILRQEGLW